ncbi:MAG TPA: ATP-binding protein [Bryobacteraceae bacterium]|nr:ATP-binding protein [Bryobacteraceae bacterium]
MARFASVSLLWRILFSTSIAITLLFAVTGWIVQSQFLRIASLSLEEEVRASFQAYESLWRARAQRLASVSMVLSRMSDVRAAFGTGDAATIRDTAGELWDNVSRDGAMFFVTDPAGVVLASLGKSPEEGLRSLPVVEAAANAFPKQATGFLVQNGRLYQVVITPVYVAAAEGSALLNVLVAGFAVDSQVAHELKQSTGGSDFVFLADGRPIASTLPSGALPPGRQQNVQIAGSDYAQFVTPLLDVQGRPSGELRILRSFEGAARRMAGLRRQMVAIWLIAVLAGLAVTYALARRILEPVKELDRAAAEIAKGNYEAHVRADGEDELGRLARTFNAMCASLRSARDELIRRERISTIGRLSTSMIHDLRNPLAAIYGGAEMLVDDDLSPPQVKRLAGNIYRSSRRILEMLQELADVTRGRAREPEMCRLREVVLAAYEGLAEAAESQRIAVDIDVPADIELPLDRSPMERVFENLISNAVEAMPEGGRLRVAAERQNGFVLVTVEDTGSGIPEAVVPRLFQPFVTSGKRNGMGLGLALSRQTVLDHGGDLWVDKNAKRGARFVMRLPA